MNKTNLYVVFILLTRAVSVTTPSSASHLNASDVVNKNKKREQKVSTSLDVPRFDLLAFSFLRWRDFLL